MHKTVNGVSLAYDLAGSGPAVLFLHAFPLTRRMWTSQIEALAGSSQTLTLDFRGFGESDKPEGPYSLEGFADDAVALARGLGVTQAVVVGLSMGGYVAFRLIERAPDFVRGLVLADTRAEPDTPEGKEKRLALADRVEREGYGALRDFVDGLVGATSKKLRPQVAAGVSQVIGQPGPKPLAATLRAMAARPDSRPKLDGITVPTLVMVGEEDTLTPPDSARVMADGIRGARLVILPSCGHVSNLEDPDAFNRELSAFVRQTV